MPDQFPSPPPARRIVLRHAAWRDRLTAAILSGVPKKSIVVDEAPPLIGSLGPRALQLGHDHYYFAHGGGLGWGVSAAVSLGLAHPGASMLCVTGDSPAIFSAQALWNAAQRNLDIVFVVLQSGEGGIAESAIRAGLSHDGARPNMLVGFNIDQPTFDVVAIGEAVGIRTLSTKGNGDVTAKVAEAFGRQGPTIIVVPVDG